MDRRIADEVLSIISPEGVAASLQALDMLETKHTDQHQALEQQLQQLEYEAQRAFLQYDEADPKNRLVVETLEQRWNEKLEKVEEVKSALYSTSVAPQDLSDQDKQRIIMLGSYFSDTWNKFDCPTLLKKKVIRCLIKEIIADTNEDKQRINLIVNWHGGSHPSLSTDRPLPASKAHKTSDEDIEIIKKWQQDIVIQKLQKY